MAKEELRKIETAALEMMLEIRRAYIASVNGKVAMNYWEQLQNRARAAALTTAGASEWVSAVIRGLRIGSLNSSGSRALLDLVKVCDETENGHDLFLRYVEREHATLIALTRRVVEEKKERDAENKIDWLESSLEGAQ